MRALRFLWLLVRPLLQFAGGIGLLAVLPFIGIVAGLMWAWEESK